MADQVRVQQDGRVLTATLENPPDALMTPRMVEELDAVIRRADSDAGVGAVVLTGAHEDRFLAHYDVAQLLAASHRSPAVSVQQGEISARAVGALARVPRASGVLEKTPAAGVLELQRFHDTLSRIGRSGAVFIAALNGSSGGGGCELAWACDLRLMADGPYVLSQPEILMGFPPGGGATQRLGRLIGRAKALELMLEGSPVEPAEAERLGMVNRLVEPERLLEEAQSTARRLARRSKPAVAATKRAVLEGGSLGLDAGLRVEQGAFMATLASEPARRAMAAYVEHYERTGTLPAYDPDARARLLDGTFADLTS